MLLNPSQTSEVHWEVFRQTKSVLQTFTVRDIASSIAYICLYCIVWSNININSKRKEAVSVDHGHHQPLLSCSSNSTTKIPSTADIWQDWNTGPESWELEEMSILTSIQGNKISFLFVVLHLASFYLRPTVPYCNCFPLYIGRLKITVFHFLFSCTMIFSILWVSYKIIS